MTLSFAVSRKSRRSGALGEEAAARHDAELAQVAQHAEAQLVSPSLSLSLPQHTEAQLVSLSLSLSVCRFPDG